MLWLGYLEVDLTEKGASSSLWAARGWRGAGCPPNLTGSLVGSGWEGCPALRPLLPGEFTWQMSRCPTPPPPPHQSDICFAKPEGDSQCKERAKKKSPESTHGDTAGSVGVIHRPIGTVTTEQLQVVGPGFGPLHGLGGHRREEFGERWSCWRMETAAGAAAFPRAHLLPPAGLQPAPYGNGNRRPRGRAGPRWVSDRCPRALVGSPHSPGSRSQRSSTQNLASNPRKSCRSQGNLHDWSP